MVSRIGILTGGGDCPGLNAAIRAVVRRALQDNLLCFGFHGGWTGVIDVEASPLDLAATRGLLHRGGTMLGTSRVDPFREERGVERIRESMDIHRLDGLIVIGGEGTLAAARRLHDDEGIPLIGIPKTIDNDVAATELTIGFSTAVDIATEAVDRLHSTAESHDRVQVLEVMGRHAGWIATFAGMAGGADSILIPEVPFDIAEVSRHLKHRAGDRPGLLDRGGGRGSRAGARHARGSRGAHRRVRAAAARGPVAHGRGRDRGAHRVRGPGHDPRSRAAGRHAERDRPDARDPNGVRAADLAMEGRWGTMTALRNGVVDAVPLAEATGGIKTVPAGLYEVAAVFFG
jgi:ATP-dependent phosphofructokinase / diphosphate-dependent phosphofructokinase